MQSFTVSGMTCGHCARAITAAVTHEDANAAVRVDLEQGKVEIDSPLPRAALARIIADEGYTVVPA